MVDLWFLLSFFFFFNLLFWRLSLEEELDQMKVHQSVGKFTVQQFSYV